MTFTRVNNGVAFALYEKFTSADANALRTNDDLFWTAHVRGLVTASFDGDAIAGGTPTSGTLGGFYWSPFWNAYIALAMPRGSTPPGYIVFAPPGGCVEHAPLATLPTGVTTAGTEPALVTLKDDVTDVTLGVIVYNDSTAGKIGVALSSDFSTWTRLYYAGTALNGNLSGSPQCSSVAIGSLGNATLTPATEVSTGRTALVHSLLSGGSLTCTLLASGTASGPPNSIATNSAGTLAAACASSSMHVVVYSTASGTITTYSAPMHADADSVTSFRRIAYDPKLDRFVYMTIGERTSVVGNGYLYWTTNDGASAWSDTVGWRRFFLGEQIVGSYPFEPLDFTITPDGAWLVIVVDNRQGSGTLGVRRTLMSFDQGATWNDCGSWARPGAGANARLSRGGPGFVLREIDTTNHIDWISVSGATTTGSVINSETL